MAQPNLLDVLILGGGAYYATQRLRDDETGDLERIVYGAAAGIPAALKGPEAVEEIKRYFSGNMPEQERDKITGSLIAGGLGYLFGDKFTGDYKEAIDSVQNEPGKGRRDTYE